MNKVFSNSATRTLTKNLLVGAPRAAISTNDLQYLKFEQRGKVGLVTLNRPKALNALCDGLMFELGELCRDLDANEEIGAIVLTGSEKAFAAGADIKEMSEINFASAQKNELLAHWQDLTKIGKPIIAAVNGFALGGGCELAMICDIILAGDKAMFGQPEIKLGTIPGCGGTQRLVKAIGKSRAMELVLTGDFMDAQEAVQRGLASRIVNSGELVDEAVKVGSKIASFSKPIAKFAKEAVNISYETTLAHGLLFERRNFFATFATHDRLEGMKAFAEKRKPDFRDN